MNTSLPIGRAVTGRASGGFSLVEVSLAILVVAIGLLTVMSIFPDALRTGKRAVDDTFISLFADEVLNGIKAQASVPGVGFANLESVQLDAPNYLLWKDPITIKDTAGQVLTVRYTVKIGTSGFDVTDHVIRYQLKIGTKSPVTKYALLKVWNGEFGSLAASDAESFYTEIFDPGI